jgi:hypothetical protein
MRLTNPSLQPTRYLWFQWRSGRLTSMGVLKLLLGAKLWRSTDPLTYSGYRRQRRRNESRDARFEREQEIGQVGAKREEMSAALEVGKTNWRNFLGLSSATGRRFDRVTKDEVLLARDKQRHEARKDDDLPSP